MQGADEVTLVLGPVVESVVERVTDEAVAAVAELVGAGLTRRRAVDIVAGLSGSPRNALYKASL